MLLFKYLFPLYYTKIITKNQTIFLFYNSIIFVKCYNLYLNIIKKNHFLLIFLEHIVNKKNNSIEKKLAPNKI